MLAKKIGAPVGFLSCAPLADPLASLYAGSPISVFSVPQFGSGLTIPMKVSDLIKNVLTSLTTAAVFWYIEFAFHRPILAAHNLHKTVDLSAESLVIVNADPLMEWPRPLPPWIKHVGPLLPTKISTAAPFQSVRHPPCFHSPRTNSSFYFTEEDCSPFFYASLGTLSALSRSEMLAIRSALNKLAPLRVIWKVDAFDFPADLTASELASDSISVVPFLPQNALLASSNIVGFLSHGGNNGLYEALFHGVPVTVIPIIADQLDNACKFAASGAALRIKSLNVELISEALIAISNPVYRFRAKQVSRVLQNRPHALSEAVSWIEFAILTKGVPYVKSGLVE